MRNKSILVLAIVVLFAVCSVSFATTASFQGLAPPPGEDIYSRALSVSGNGLVVVGYSSVTPYPEDYRHAFRWTEEEGMVTLAGFTNSYAKAASYDGSTVVGGIGGVNGFLWTETDGMCDFRALSGVGVRSSPYDVSADGRVVVGVGFLGSGYEAFRWAEGTEIVGLGDLAGGSFYSVARGVSADGSVVVGESFSTTGKTAFRWTESGGMQNLGYLPKSEKKSYALSVSADGSTVVGYCITSDHGDRLAFRWTVSEGMVDLGDIPYGYHYRSSAQDVSADGSVIVGYIGHLYTLEEAFIWDNLNGMRTIKSLLESDYELDLSGWTLRTATGVSDDGLTIVGYGTNPAGNDEAWMLTFYKALRQVPVDIKPNSCPNPVNVKSSGVLPIAILGSEEFDVTDVDVASIQLAGVEPLRSGYEDVAAPVSDTNDCNCITDGPDGFLDLILKFKTQRIVEAVGDVNDGDELQLELIGVLFDETPIEGADCILIRGRHKPINPADINKDGVVNTADFAIFAQNWLQSSIVD